MLTITVFSLLSVGENGKPDGEFRKAEEQDEVSAGTQLGVSGVLTMNIFYIMQMFSS